MNKKMVEVKECDVPVVGVDYLESAGEGAALLKIPGCTISEWGAPRHSLPVQDESEIGLKSFKSRGQLVYRALGDLLAESCSVAYLGLWQN